MQLNIKTEHGELRLQPYANTVVHSPHSCLYFFHAYHRNIASSIIFAQCTGFIGVDHIFAQSSAQLEGNRGFDIDVFQSGALFTKASVCGSIIATHPDLTKTPLPSV